MYLDVIAITGVFGILPLIAVVVILGRAYWSYQLLIKKGLKTEGEIIDYEEYSDGKGKKSFFPIIRFKTYHGQEIHQRTSYGLNARNFIDKGSIVEVVYSASNPNRFMLNKYSPLKTEEPAFLGFIVGFGMN
ncbi:MULTISPECIES: DUF3592 domain-containing protein [Emticicia]|jgi:hypothetical protein|uniref:DUF3592 domain-containing protein n=1 Tax=Emticicia TaxID=312278 RepID=UPI000C76909D|nr:MULTISPECIES: DUF3592 domain-containing protein [Emticicia]PLK45941.1 hypothetical protein C0V77_00880 [Emticicia sp. TH156]UTA67721.1 DUF3592 domain-containing protein [Emticicia sp. 21SJ11W-3]